MRFDLKDNATSLVHILTPSEGHRGTMGEKLQAPLEPTFDAGLPFQLFIARTIF